jgi:hypothetical protein
MNEAADKNGNAEVSEIGGRADLDAAAFEKQCEALGFQFDHPNAKRLLGWNFIMCQVHVAKGLLERLAAADAAPVQHPDHFIHQYANLTSLLITYGRCFASGPNKKLMADATYKGHPEALETHNKLIAWRNNFAAHTGNSELAAVSAGIREEQDRIVVIHMVHYALPYRDFVAMRHMLRILENYVVISMNRHHEKMEAATGKPVHVGLISDYMK